MKMHALHEITVELVDSDDGFRKLRADWERLASSDEVSSIFTSWLWQSCWWQQYGSAFATDRRLHILVARHGAGGQVVGILPLYACRERLLKIASIRALRFIGNGGDTSPDYLNPLLCPEFAPQASVAFARYLATAPWQLLTLYDIGTSKMFRNALVQELATQRIALKSGVSSEISWIALPSDWDEYLSSLSKNRRYQVRNQRRKFEASGNVRFFVWDNPASLDDAIDTLISLHLDRWEDRDEQHAFSTDNYKEFHRSLMHQLMDHEQLRLYCLELDGKLVAMLYCYRWQEGVYFFQAGFNTDYESLRVGNVIMAYAIEHAIGEGNQVFDMLKGDYRYKRSLARERHSTWFVTAVRHSLSGTLYRLRFELLPALKKRLRG